MSDKIAISESKAATYLAQSGIPRMVIAQVLAGCRIASRFSGVAFYYPKDLDKCADKYLSA